MASDPIQEVYESITQPGRIVELMEKLGRRLDAESAFLFTSHSETAPEAILLGQNMDPAVVKDFASYWAQEDVWAAAARAQGLMQRGVVVVDEDLLSKQRLRQSRFYNEFSKNAGMDSMLGTILFDGQEPGGDIPFTNLCWYRPAGKHPFSKGDKQLLKTLLPHLQQGLKLQWQMQRMRLNDLAAGYAGVGPPLASIVLDWGGRIASCNARAEALLAGSRALLRCKDGHLLALGQQSSPSLAEALARCRATRHAVRMLVREEGSGELFRATLNALPADAETHFGIFGRPCCLLLIELPRDDMRETLQLYSQLYNLTAAELEVLTGLVNGLSAEQVAQLKDRSIATVRTQVRSLLAKTGSERQADLLRTVARLG
ncbi:helix-turn-helix transcriptional regulator [Pseudoduganella sp. OTU4001]|uniref:helix-turn-helix transcriptional regulator n=1 Tax=Pseudoduganella sp. OTU4001 TaxID=3043854 RepID=UPI00313DF2FB